MEKKIETSIPGDFIVTSEKIAATIQELKVPEGGFSGGVIDPNAEIKPGKTSIAKPRAQRSSGSFNNNRRERRNLLRKMKGMGLIPKHETAKDAAERKHRSQIAGDQIHAQFLAQVETTLRSQKAEHEAEQLRALTATWGEEKARKIISDNRRIEEKRIAKLKRRGIK